MKIHNLGIYIYLSNNFNAFFSLINPNITSAIGAFLLSDKHLDNANFMKFVPKLWELITSMVLTLLVVHLQELIDKLSIPQE